MAEIIEADSGSKKEGKRRKPRKMGAEVDMTPMVDLICLLITFFMLTTAFSKPKVMEITMPEKGNEIDPPKDVNVAAIRTYSVLLGENDKIYWYWHQDAEKEGATPSFDKWKRTDYSKDGIRKFLLEKNDVTVKEIEQLKEKVKTGLLVMPNDTLIVKIKEIKKKHSKSNKTPIILIKAVEKAKYRNLVDIIDEMAICDIASYAVVDPAVDEIEMLKSAPK
jgi:biopolymer transport protein ExbD